MNVEVEMSLRLLVAAALGLIVGFERELDGQPAGLRTHALTATGSALFAITSSLAFEGGDPTRIAAQVVSGLGFLGGGMIVQGKGVNVRNLTTAAGIWGIGAVGLAVGSGLYILGSAGAGIVLILLASGRLMRRWRITTNRIK